MTLTKRLSMKNNTEQPAGCPPEVYRVRARLSPSSIPDCSTVRHRSNSSWCLYPHERMNLREKRYQIHLERAWCICLRSFDNRKPACDGKRYVVHDRPLGLLQSCSGSSPGPSYSCPQTVARTRVFLRYLLITRLQGERKARRSKGGCRQEISGSFRITAKTPEV